MTISGHRHSLGLPLSLTIEKHCWKKKRMTFKISLARFSTYCNPLSTYARTTTVFGLLQSPRIRRDEVIRSPYLWILTFKMTKGNPINSTYYSLNCIKRYPATFLETFNCTRKQQRFMRGRYKKLHTALVGRWTLAHASVDFGPAR